MRRNQSRFLSLPAELLLMALCLSKACQPSPRDTSSTEKRGTHHELLSILLAIPTCRPLLPYAPKLDTVPLETIQLDNDLTYEEKPIKILEFASRVTHRKVIRFCKV